MPKISQFVREILFKVPPRIYVPEDIAVVFRPAGVEASFIWHDTFKPPPKKPFYDEYHVTQIEAEAVGRKEEGELQANAVYAEKLRPALGGKVTQVLNESVGDISKRLQANVVYVERIPSPNVKATQFLNESVGDLKKRLQSNVVYVEKLLFQTKEGNLEILPVEEVPPAPYVPPPVPYVPYVPYVPPLPPVPSPLFFPAEQVWFYLCASNKTLVVYAWAVGVIDGQMRLYPFQWGFYPQNVYADEIWNSPYTNFFRGADNIYDDALPWGDVVIPGDTYLDPTTWEGVTYDTYAVHFLLDNIIAADPSDIVDEWKRRINSAPNKEALFHINLWNNMHYRNFARALLDMKPHAMMGSGRWTPTFVRVRFWTFEAFGWLGHLWIRPSESGETSIAVSWHLLYSSAFPLLGAQPALTVAWHTEILGSVPKPVIGATIYHEYADRYKVSGKIFVGYGEGEVEGTEVFGFSCDAYNANYLTPPYGYYDGNALLAVVGDYRGYV